MKTPKRPPDFLDDPEYGDHPYGVIIEWDRIRRGEIDVDAPIDLVLVQDEKREAHRARTKPGRRP